MKNSHTKIEIKLVSGLGTEFKVKICKLHIT